MRSTLGLEARSCVRGAVDAARAAGGACPNPAASLFLGADAVRVKIDGGVKSGSCALAPADDDQTSDPGKAWPADREWVDMVAQDRVIRRLDQFDDSTDFVGRPRGQALKPLLGTKDPQKRRQPGR
jgi:hypothetical protein